MNKTKIEWADMVWNPVSGCSKFSAGCKNCYAERHAGRFWGDRKFTDVRIHLGKLGEPLRRKKPSVIFVNSMSDLFHAVDSYFIEEVFEVMNTCPQHIFLVLTKRIAQAVSYFDVARRPNKNIWFGVSVEDQKSADGRIPKLLSIPVQNCFISAEPILAPIDLSKYLDRLGWVIVGGESGPNARPMHPDWARSIRDQCKDAGVPFFFKQWGEWFPRSQWEHNPDLILPGDECFFTADNFGAKTRYLDDDHEITHRVGKKAAGRLLDGREYLEFPEAIAKVKNYRGKR